MEPIIQNDYQTRCLKVPRLLTLRRNRESKQIPIGNRESKQSPIVTQLASICPKIFWHFSLIKSPKEELSVANL